MPSASLPGPADPSTSTSTSTATPEPQLLQLGPDLTVYVGAERDARFIYKEIYQDHCYDVGPLPPSPCMLLFQILFTSSAYLGVVEIHCEAQRPSS